MQINFIQQYKMPVSGLLLWMTDFWWMMVKFEETEVSMFQCCDNLATAHEQQPLGEERVAMVYRKMLLGQY